MEGSHHPFFGLYQVSRGRREVSVKGEQRARGAGRDALLALAWSKTITDPQLVITSGNKSAGKEMRKGTLCRIFLRFPTNFAFSHTLNLLDSTRENLEHAWRLLPLK